MKSVLHGILHFLICLLFLPATACRKQSPQPEQSKLISFLLIAPKAQAIFLAGTFNGWNTTSTPMHRNANGRWEVDLPLKPSRYSYKFIADGHWLPDPANSETEPDGHGGRNSKLTVNPGASDDGPV